MGTVINSFWFQQATDPGATWTERTSAGSRNWISVASSSDGTKLVAVVASGYICTSP